MLRFGKSNYFKHVVLRILSLLSFLPSSHSSKFFLSIRSNLHISFMLFICLYHWRITLSGYVPPKGMGTAEDLPIQTLSPCLFSSSLLWRIPLKHVLLYPILPSPKWPSSTVWTHNFTHMDFLHKIFTIHSLTMFISPHCTSFHLFHHSIHYSCLSFLTISFMHVFIPLIISPHHSTCPSQTTHFHSTHFWLLCPIPHPRLWSIRQCRQEDAIP